MQIEKMQARTRALVFRIFFILFTNKLLYVIIFDSKVNYTKLSDMKNNFLVFVEIFSILIYNLLCINMENFMDKKKYLILTYGCQMNVHESEKLAGILESNGYEVCDNARSVINENVVIYEGTAKVSGSFYVGLSCGIPDIKPINLSIGYYYPLGQLTSEVEDIKTNSGSAITDGSGKNAIQQKLDADKPTWSIGNEAVSVLVAEGIVAVNEKGEVIPGANGDFSSVLGGKGLALGKRSSARGTSSIALGAYSCAEGDQALAQGMGSNAIGCATSAIGPYSSSKGIKAKAIGEGSDAGGCETQAEGQFSFARGYKTIAKGLFASTFGAETEADESCQFVVGRHNLNKNDTLFEVGNGEAGSKSNAFEVCTDGSIRCGKQTTSSSGAYVLVTKGYLDMIVAQLQAQINSLK